MSKQTSKNKTRLSIGAILATGSLAAAAVALTGEQVAIAESAKCITVAQADPVGVTEKVLEAAEEYKKMQDAKKEQKEAEERLKKQLEWAEEKKKEIQEKKEKEKEENKIKVEKKPPSNPSN